MVRVCKRVAFLASMPFLLGMFVVSVSPVVAVTGLVWEGEVSSSGNKVVSLILENGWPYRIVAMNTWWYNLADNLAADAMYYTTNSSNNNYWGIHFRAPGNHSFLQIDEQDFDWGPFSDGDTSHTYTIYYVGNGSAIAFRIVDWVDGNYGNNECHINVKIFLEANLVGGYVVDRASPEIFKYVAVGALVLAGAVAVPIAKYHRKIRVNQVKSG